MLAASVPGVGQRLATNVVPRVAAPDVGGRPLARHVGATAVGQSFIPQIGRNASGWQTPGSVGQPMAAATPPFGISRQASASTVSRQVSASSQVQGGYQPSSATMSPMPPRPPAMAASASAPRPRVESMDANGRSRVDTMSTRVETEDSLVWEGNDSQVFRSRVLLGTDNSPALVAVSDTIDAALEPLPAEAYVDNQISFSNSKFQAADNRFADDTGFADVCAIAVQENSSTSTCVLSIPSPQSVTSYPLSPAWTYTVQSSSWTYPADKHNSTTAPNRDRKPCYAGSFPGSHGYNTGADQRLAAAESRRLNLGVEPKEASPQEDSFCVYQPRRWRSKSPTRKPEHCFDDLYADAMERHRRQRIRKVKVLEEEYAELSSRVDRFNKEVEENQTIWPGKRPSSPGDVSPYVDRRAEAQRRKESLHRHLVAERLAEQEDAVRLRSSGVRRQSSRDSGRTSPPWAPRRAGSVDSHRTSGLSRGSGAARSGSVDSHRAGGISIGSGAASVRSPGAGRRQLYPSRSHSGMSARRTSCSSEVPVGSRAPW